MTLAERRRAAPVAALAAALLASCTGPPATPGSTTSAGHGENVLVREPLPTIPANFKVMAATGDVVWASTDGTSENRLSLDGGATWTAGVDQREITLPVGYRVRFGYRGGDDGEGTPYEMDPAAPVRAAQLSRDDDGRIVAVGVAGALSRSGLLMTRSAVGRIDFAALPSGAGKAVHSYAFSGDAALVLRITTTAGHDYAALVDTATRKALGTIELPVARQHVVAGSAVHSLVADARGRPILAEPHTHDAPHRLAPRGSRSRSARADRHRVRRSRLAAGQWCGRGRDVRISLVDPGRWALRGVRQRPPG